MRFAYIFISDGRRAQENEKSPMKKLKESKKMENVIYIVANINHSTRPNEINFLFISSPGAARCCGCEVWVWACVCVLVLGIVSDILFFLPILGALERMSDSEICSLALNFGKKKNEMRTHTAAQRAHPAIECSVARAMCQKKVNGNSYRSFCWFFIFSFSCIQRLRKTKQTAARRHSQFASGRAFMLALRIHISQLGQAFSNLFAFFPRNGGTYFHFSDFWISMCTAHIHTVAPSSTHTHVSFRFFCAMKRTERQLRAHTKNFVQLNKVHKQYRDGHLWRRHEQSIRHVHLSPEHLSSRALGTRIQNVYTQKYNNNFNKCKRTMAINKTKNVFRATFSAAAVAATAIAGPCVCSIWDGERNGAEICDDFGHNANCQRRGAKAAARLCVQPHIYNLKRERWTHRRRHYRRRRPATETEFSVVLRRREEMRKYNNNKNEIKTRFLLNANDSVASVIFLIVDRRAGISLVANTVDNFHIGRG